MKHPFAIRRIFAALDPDSNARAERLEMHRGIDSIYEIHTVTPSGVMGPF